MKDYPNQSLDDYILLRLTMWDKIRLWSFVLPLLALFTLIIYGISGYEVDIGVPVVKYLLLIFVLGLLATIVLRALVAGRLNRLKAEYDKP